MGNATAILLPSLDLMLSDHQLAYENQSFSDRHKGTGQPPLLQRSILQDLDLAYGTSALVVCSQRLRDAVDKHSLTNFRFLPTVVI